MFKFIIAKKIKNSKPQSQCEFPESHWELVQRTEQQISFLQGFLSKKQNKPIQEIQVNSASHEQTQQMCKSMPIMNFEKSKSSQFQITKARSQKDHVFGVPSRTEKLQKPIIHEMHNKNDNSKSNFYPSQRQKSASIKSQTCINRPKTQDTLNSNRNNEHSDNNSIATYEGFNYQIANKFQNINQQQPMIQKKLAVRKARAVISQINLIYEDSNQNLKESNQSLDRNLLIRKLCLLQNIGSQTEREPNSQNFKKSFFKHMDKCNTSRKSRFQLKY